MSGWGDSGMPCVGISDGIVRAFSRPALGRDVPMRVPAHVMVQIANLDDETHDGF